LVKVKFKKLKRKLLKSKKKKRMDMTGIQRIKVRQVLLKTILKRNPKRVKRDNLILRKIKEKR